MQFKLRFSVIKTAGKQFGQCNDLRFYAIVLEHILFQNKKWRCLAKVFSFIDVHIMGILCDSSMIYVFYISKDILFTHIIFLQDQNPGIASGLDSYLVYVCQ